MSSSYLSWDEVKRLIYGPNPDPDGMDCGSISGSSPLGSWDMAFVSGGCMACVSGASDASFDGAPPLTTSSSGAIDFDLLSRTESPACANGMPPLTLLPPQLASLTFDPTFQANQPPQVPAQQFPPQSTFRTIDRMPVCFRNDSKNGKRVFSIPGVDPCNVAIELPVGTQAKAKIIQVRATNNLNLSPKPVRGGWSLQQSDPPGLVSHSHVPTVAGMVLRITSGPHTEAICYTEPYILFSQKRVGKGPRPPRVLKLSFVEPTREQILALSPRCNPDPMLN